MWCALSAYVEGVRVGERPEGQTGADVGLDEVRVDSGLGALLADDPRDLEVHSGAAADGERERLALRVLSRRYKPWWEYRH